MILLGAATGSPGDPIGQLAAQGVFGLVAALTILGAYWVIRKIEQSHQRELSSKDSEIGRLEAEVAALRRGLDETYTFTRDRTVPALTSTGEALVRSTEINREYLQHLARQVPR